MNPNSPTPPRRKLKITILTVGSVGDVQPYCALAIGLKRAGHEVTVAANENFESFVRQFDLEFAPIAGDTQKLFQSKAGIRAIGGEKVKSLCSNSKLKIKNSKLKTGYGGLNLPLIEDR